MMFVQPTSQDPSLCRGECVFVPMCKIGREIIAGGLQGKLWTKAGELHFYHPEKETAWRARWTTLGRSHTNNGRKLLKTTSGGDRTDGLSSSQSWKGNHVDGNGGHWGLQRWDSALPLLCRPDAHEGLRHSMAIWVALPSASPASVPCTAMSTGTRDTLPVKGTLKSPL